MAAPPLESPTHLADDVTVETRHTNRSVATTRSSAASITMLTFPRGAVDNTVFVTNKSTGSLCSFDDLGDDSESSYKRSYAKRYGYTHGGRLGKAGKRSRQKVLGQRMAKTEKGGLPQVVGRNQQRGGSRRGSNDGGPHSIASETGTLKSGRTAATIRTFESPFGDQSLKLSSFQPIALGAPVRPFRNEMLPLDAKLQQLEEAAKLAQRGQTRAAEQHLHELAQAFPADLEVVYALVSCLRLQGRQEEVYQWCQYGVRVGTAHPPSLAPEPEPQQQQQQHFPYAFEESRTPLRVVAEHVYTREFLFIMANACIGAGEVFEEDALALCERMLSLEGYQTDGRAFSLMGTVASRRGNLVEAIRHGTKAVQAAPDLFIAHSLVIEAYGALGRWDKVIKAVDRCLEHSGASPNPNSSSVWKRLLGEVGNPATRPEVKALLYCTRAEACRQLGKMNDAIRDASRAANACPSCAAAYSIRGEVFYQLRQWKRSAADYGIARNLDRQAEKGGADPLPGFIPTRALWRDR
eukprot:CAMPEP_0118880304 /NCGR_PEP_ID=MMETSP1163-20130328/19907_1 /TAXON_ID=124430 /ORGANISM="Phaeomonas parva, Strain CCMP2877" /LENGTH=521 /DNA_ID=CAMNT_0006816673 /DNA_START=440 /DNA_END=2005 /DNA_ORIENTATION=+